MKVARLLGYNEFVVEDFGIHGQMDDALLIEVPGGLDEGFDLIVEWQRRIEELLDYDDLQHLTEDFMSSDAPARLWAFQNALLLPDNANPDRLLESDIANAGFAPILLDDAELLGIACSDGRRRLNYTAINVGSGYLHDGVLGEYLCYLGASDSCSWRQQAPYALPEVVNWANLSIAEPALAAN